jgi:hypothetical protein
MVQCLLLWVHPAASVERITVSRAGHFSCPVRTGVVLLGDWRRALGAGADGAIRCSDQAALARMQVRAAARGAHVTLASYMKPLAQAGEYMPRSSSKAHLKQDAIGCAISRRYCLNVLVAGRRSGHRLPGLRRRHRQSRTGGPGSACRCRAAAAACGLGHNRRRGVAGV